MTIEQLTREVTELKAIVARLEQRVRVLEARPLQLLHIGPDGAPSCTYGPMWQSLQNLVSA